jgi:hypothetical protein
MQFPARVGRSSACVRIKLSRLEWSLVGTQWVIQMAPMASISAVSFETGLSKSNLFVTTTLGVADFCVDPEIAEQARTLLMQLMAEAQSHPEAAVNSSSVDSQGRNIDELINLKWMVDAAASERLDMYEEPTRAFGL